MLEGGFLLEGKGFLEPPPQPAWLGLFFLPFLSVGLPRFLFWKWGLDYKTRLTLNSILLPQSLVFIISIFFSSSPNDLAYSVPMRQNGGGGSIKNLIPVYSGQGVRPTNTGPTQFV